MIEDQIVGRVARLADLLEDDLALALELALVEGGVDQDVGDEIERDVDILFQHAGMKRGLLPARVGIEIAADLLRSPSRCPWPSA